MQKRTVNLNSVDPSCSWVVVPRQLTVNQAILPFPSVVPCSGNHLTAHHAALTSFLKNFLNLPKMPQNNSAQLTEAFNPGHTSHLGTSTGQVKSSSSSSSSSVPQVSYHILSQVTPEFQCSSVATRKTHKTDKKLCCPNYHWAFCQHASTCPSIWIIHPQTLGYSFRRTYTLLQNTRHSQELKSISTQPFHCC